MQQTDSRKFYSIDNLQKFKKNSLILYRNDVEDTCYTYSNVIDEVRHFIIIFNKQNIPHKIGIAVHLPSKHTPGTCVVLLSVLEHNCYFCPLDSNSLEEQLSVYNANFLITYVKQTEYTFLDTLNVFEEQFYLYQTKCNKLNNLDISDDLCYCINTSGSTGIAKTVQVPYTCIAPNVLALSQLFEITCQDAIYFGTPLTFDPSVVEFFLAIKNGASLLMANPTLHLDSVKLLDALFPNTPEKRGVSLMQMTPSNFRLFGTKHIRNHILAVENSLRILVLGGEEFPRRDELLRWYSENCSKIHKRIFNIYGITELSCWSTIHEYVHASADISTEKRVPLGKPIDRTTIVRLVKPHTNIALSGRSCQGELQVGSDKRKCWLTNDDNCQPTQSEIVFRSTGDLVEIDANDNLYFLGRLNRTIKRHGKRLCLDALGKHIENILSSSFTQPVAAACIWKNKLICVLVLPEKSALIQKKAQRLLIDALAKHNIPDFYMFLEHLPLTAHGKLNTRQLLTIWRENISTAALTSSTPMNLFCVFLRNALALNVSDSVISNNYSRAKKSKTFLNDSFYAAGGTSFQALTFATEMAHMFVSDEMQRNLLDMLLNSNIKLIDIFKYLRSCETTACAMQEKAELVTAKIMLRWRADLQRCVDATPASTRLVNGRHCICIGSHAHLLLTFDACTGEELARLELPDRIECQVVFSISKSNFALVGCYDGFVYAFDYLNGKIYWSINAGGIVKARPLLLPLANCVVIASYGLIFNLMCINLENQNVVWNCKLGDKGIFAAPILLNDNEEFLLVCTLAGTYACLSAKCGTIKWQQQCASPIFSTPTCLFQNKSLFIVAEVNGNVHFCNSTNGNILETFQGNGNIFSGLSVELLDENSAYIAFGCYDKCLYCLKYEKTKSIQLLWKLAFQSPIYATPKLVVMNKTNGIVDERKKNLPLTLDKNDDVILACSTKGQLALVSLNSGHLKATYDLNGEVFSTPCITNNRCYVGCRDNFVYSFALPY